MKRLCLLFLVSILFSTFSLGLFSQDFYWEAPVSISRSHAYFPSFAKSSATGNDSIIIWQEVENNAIWISTAVYRFTGQGYEWVKNERFAGPFPFSGEIPQISTVAMNKRGQIACAIIADTHTISVYSSSDSGQSFAKTNIEHRGEPLLAPRIYATSKNGFIIFASEGDDEAFLLRQAESADGYTWSAFREFEPSKHITNPFIPVLTETKEGDLVVFQASHSSGTRLSYQLFSSLSTDGGRNWSPVKLLTDETQRVLGEENQIFTNFHNQRANLLYFNGKTYIAWERTHYASENAAIYFSELQNANTLGPIEKISDGQGNASNPILFAYNNTISLVWFDTRSGKEDIYFTQKTGLIWSDENRLSSGTNSALFGIPIVSDNGKSVDFFWQEQNTRSSHIVHLAPDRTIAKPSIIARNFIVGKKAASERVQFQIQLPQDSSGIAGFSYLWTKNPYLEAPRILQNLPSQTALTEWANEDGDWFLKVKALDYAGNWSEDASISYTRDTKPPEKPIIHLPDFDDDGFVISNTLPFTWEASDDETIGYSYSLEYMDAVQKLPITGEQELKREPAKPPLRILTENTKLNLTNIENGFYAFSVSAIDEVGNVSEPTIITIAFNKFIPYTAVTNLSSERTLFGNYVLSILGRGFSSEGFVSKIGLLNESTNEEQFFYYDAGDYKIVSDRSIRELDIGDMEEGSYKVRLYHEKRGLYSIRQKLTILETGTVKIGDYSYVYAPQIRGLNEGRAFSIGIHELLISLLIVLVFIILLVSIQGIISSSKEMLLIKQEVQILITGVSMTKPSRKKTKELYHKGMSLKYKLVFFTSSLIIMIIILVSLPLGYLMTSTQEETLAEGLEEKTEVLLESLASSVKAYLPTQNVLELSFLPNQSNALKEALYTTIVGLPAAGDNTDISFIWATNDAEIETYIDTKEINFGSSRYTRDYIETISEKAHLANDLAVEKVSHLADEITRLTAEGIGLAGRNDADSIERLNEIQNATRSLNESLSEELNQLSKEYTESIPAFNTKNLSRDTTDYIFYKPVLYRQGTEKDFVRGIVILSVSTESLIYSVESAQKTILITTGIIALLALSIGLIITLILASVIIKPIRQLAAHVAMIRDTDDKEQLEGKDILLKSRDEIGLLGDTVNDMAQGLVRAAAASKDLTVGKEVQKMFIPLETDSFGKKLTTGSEVNENAEFFGYYEGAKGVSGDYFDYKKLDDTWYAIIKCDVAGKGVPAALIMVEVATLFLNYFKDWSFKTHGTKLDTIVSQINDLIESRGFKGRFAAFTLCLLNSISGEAYFCNAGDNLVHIYSKRQKKNIIETLPDSAAAGVFPSFMVDLKGGFQTVKLNLQKDDVLFMYTDGIEEAKRNFRDSSFKIIECAEAGLNIDDPHENHSVGQDNEELGPDRVNAIVEAVFDRKKYRLTKFHNPIVNEVLEFDFSSLSGTAEDAILALVSVEKIFRMYKDPSATDFDRVQVDRKIDSFLQKVFVQYNSYCANKIDHPSLDEYLLYKGIKEDEQYDDLTLVAIKKK